MQVRKPKLEIGDFATDWSPSPNDVYQEIGTVRSEISQTAEQVLIKVDNQISNESIKFSGKSFSRRRTSI